MTAKERSDTAYALCRHCTGMTCNGLCRDCCTDAILAHAEAVREEAAKIAETAYPATRKGIAAAIRAMKVT